MKSILMLVTCLIVGGAMVVLFTWFTRRLRAIEERRWGDKTRPVKEPKQVS